MLLSILNICALLHARLVLLKKYPTVSLHLENEFDLIQLLEQYKIKRCSKKECCKQCSYVTFKGTMTKRPVQKHTDRHKHVEHHNATDN